MNSSRDATHLTVSRAMSPTRCAHVAVSHDANPSPDTPHARAFLANMSSSFDTPNLAVAHETRSSTACNLVTVLPHDPARLATMDRSVARTMSSLRNAPTSFGLPNPVSLSRRTPSNLGYPKFELVSLRYSTCWLPNLSSSSRNGPTSGCPDVSSSRNALFVRFPARKAG